MHNDKIRHLRAKLGAAQRALVNSDVVTALNECSSGLGGIDRTVISNARANDWIEDIRDTLDVCGDLSEKQQIAFALTVDNLAAWCDQLLSLDEVTRGSA